MPAKQNDAALSWNQTILDGSSASSTHCIAILWTDGLNSGASHYH